MSKMIWEFDLPDEKADLALAQAGADFYHAMFDFSNELRSMHKYGEKSKDYQQAVEDIREIFLNFLSDVNIDLDTIVE